MRPFAAVMTRPLTAFLRGHDRPGAALERENERADRRDIPAPSHRHGAGCCDTSMGSARQCRMAGQSLRWMAGQSLRWLAVQAGVLRHSYHRTGLASIVYPP